MALRDLPGIITLSSKRGKLSILAAFTFICLNLSIAVWYLPTHITHPDASTHGPPALSNIGLDGHADKSDAGGNFHLLLPATQGNVDLCKTVLTAKLLDYPTPGLLAWNDTYDVPEQMAGGSHLAKIFRVLEFLEGLAPSQDSDLVLMIDAYDIWFQLRADVMIERFHSMNAIANARLSKRLGSITEKEQIEQKIIFGAGKRCAPNQLHSVACYPVPMSPLPDDLYGNNTDTVIGRNKYTSYRQRYLNSGYVMGRVSDMRKLFRIAAEEVKRTPNHIPELDNGSGGSDFLYHGSDQSIFNTLFGRQEYRREYLRAQTEEEITEWPELTLEGMRYSNPLNPPFEHEKIERYGDPSNEDWELGIGLDYSSELGHQTANAETDGKWLKFNQKPLDVDFPGKNRFDCPPRVEKESALSGLRGVRPPFLHEVPNNANTWESTPLYTNLCTGKIPVMVHHNGDKNARGYRWKDMWFQANAKEMLAEKFIEGDASAKSGISRNVIAWTDKASQLTWNDLCGADGDGIFS